mmetsp:Transcript_27586/g.55343  ORF Transcript_27586/g.55343 Transcript_27586/m.55343 type:complete len:82 (+) Transcript_27586:521-766(+)
MQFGLFFLPTDLGTYQNASIMMFTRERTGSFPKSLHVKGEAMMCCCVLAHLRPSTNASKPINKIHPITSRVVPKANPWTLK